MACRATKGRTYFLGKDSALIYIGRIFVDPSKSNTGYGPGIMKQIEAIFSKVLVWELETPVWNVRTITNGWVKGRNIAQSTKICK